MRFLEPKYDLVGAMMYATRRLDLMFVYRCNVAALDVSSSGVVSLGKTIYFTS